MSEKRAGLHFKKLL